MPIDRAAKYERPIEAALEPGGLGRVTGGGSQLGKARADGTMPIDFVGIDVDLYDLEKGLAALRSALRAARAPNGTVLEYERQGRRLSEPL